MDDLSPAEKKAIGKRISAVRHRLNNPGKEGREEWSPEERAKLEAKIAELEAERGPVEGRKPVIPGWEEGTIARPKSEKRNPWDDLAARRGQMRRVDGMPDPPKIEKLLKHAEKFGTENVLEAAAEMGYGHDALERLADGLDRIDAAEYRAKHPKAPPISRGDVAKRVEALVGPREAAA